MDKVVAKLLRAMSNFDKKDLEIPMFKRNHISVAIAATAILITSYASAESATGTAEVTVQNVFQLISTTSLNFGSLRITQPAAQETATPFFVTIDNTGAITVGDGTASDTDDNATGNAISGHALALFTISAAAPNTPLTLTVADENGYTGTNVSDAITGMNGIPIVDGDSNPAFTLYADITHTFASNTSAALGADGVGLITDGGGNATLQIGGILAYDADNTGSPASEVFTGDYAITLNY